MENGMPMNEQNELAAKDDDLPLQVEYWPLDRLIPYARNARTHSAAQIAEIAGSMRAFGFSNPILVGEGGDVIAGHGRLAAARKLELGGYAQRFDRNPTSAVGAR
jgi:hypothetical protein